MSTGRISSALTQFVEFAQDVVYDKREGKAAFLLGSFLFVLSLLMRVAVKLRFFLYDRGILIKSRPLGCLVVVVGNLTVGGTGKTPVVERFARSLQQRGRKVAILSRGYKSKDEHRDNSWAKFKRAFITGMAPPLPKVVSDGEKVLLDSEYAGDEPYMLARNLPGVVVLVDKDRVKSGLHAIRKFGCDTLVLDDGFQYLGLRGRLNLLLVDKTNPFGNRNLLPRGILREPVKHLRRASYVFLTKSNGRDDPELDAMIRKYNPNVDIIETSHSAKYLQEVNGSERHDLTFLVGKRIASFSAIAPSSLDIFEADLRKRGAKLIYPKRFMDHHRFDRDELDSIFSEAVKAGLEYVVTTEKDAVRIPQEWNFPLPLYYLRLEIEILRGSKDFDEAVGKVCFPGEARLEDLT